MERENVSPPIAAPALVPAPFPTADMPAPGPVPVHSVVCDIAALLHPSFSRNRSLSRTVVLDRARRVYTLGRVIAEGEGEESTAYPVTIVSIPTPK